MLTSAENEGSALTGWPQRPIRRMLAQILVSDAAGQQNRGRRRFRNAAPAWRETWLRLETTAIAWGIAGALPSPPRASLALASLASTALRCLYHRMAHRWRTRVLIVPETLQEPRTARSKRSDQARCIMQCEEKAGIVTRCCRTAGRQAFATAFRLDGHSPQRHP